MTYPSCPQCGDQGPHRMREAGVCTETWTCGFCGEAFTIEIAEPESVGISEP